MRKLHYSCYSISRLAKIQCVAKQWLPQQVLLDGEPAKGLLRNHQGQLWLSLQKGIHQLQFTGVLPNRNTIQLP